MKRRIVVVTTVADTVNYILYDIIKNMTDHFDVSVICDDSEKIKHIDGVSVYSVPMKRGISPLYDVLSFFLMVKTLLKIKPYLVHSYTPKAGLVAMLSAFLCRVQVRVHTFTGLIFPSVPGFKGRILKLADKAVAGFSTVTVSESQGVRNELLRAGIVSSKAESPIIGNGNIAGVNVEYFDPDQRSVLHDGNSIVDEFSLHGCFVFCYVGRLNRDKGIKELVESFRELPVESRLLIVGAIDYSSPPDTESMTEVESNPRIHLVGFKADIRGCLAASDVLVLPSYREGFPNVVLQAMAMKCPVISTDVSGSNEVVANGETGWLVPIRDVEAFRDGMLAAFQSSRDLLNFMGHNGRNTVIDRYDREDYTSALIDFYKFF